MGTRVGFQQQKQKVGWKIAKMGRGEESKKPQHCEADVAQSVGARPSELEGRQFDPYHSIDVCFDFPLFRVAVALNTRKTEH